MSEQMSEKQWTKQMGQKFLEWRINNNYSGMISVPEVARFAQEVILETKEIYQK